jgi:hypothetical protein
MLMFYTIFFEEEKFILAHGFKREGELTQAREKGREDRREGLLFNYTFFTYKSDQSWSHYFVLFFLLPQVTFVPDLPPAH